MEIVAQTDYQDIYRITDGVLFIVNKFISIDYSNLIDERIHIYRKEAKYKSYNKNCQNWLKVLKKDYKYEYYPIIIPKGTVTYMDIPVICTNDKDKWKYELKTTGSCFSGNYDKMLDLITEVYNIVIETNA